MVLDAGRVGLLVVDMQNEFVGRERARVPARRLAAAVETIARLVEAFHVAARPVVYTRVCFRHGHLDAHRDSPARRSGALLEDDPTSAIIDRLAPGPLDPVVTKRRTGAFYQTDLDLLLAALGVQELVVTGLSTPRAVESTVREAHSRDLDCYVVRDGTYADDLGFHEASLAALGEWFAQVVSGEDALAALRGAASARSSGTSGPARR